MSNPEGQGPTTPAEGQPTPETPGQLDGAPDNIPSFANEHVENAMKKLHEDAAVRAGKALQELQALHERGIIDEVPAEEVIIGAVLKRVHRGGKASGIIAKP